MINLDNNKNDLAKVTNLNRDSSLTTIGLVLFDNGYGCEVTDQKAVTAMALTCKTILEFVFGEEWQKCYWELHVRQKYSAYENDYKFKINKWSHFFCTYSQEIFELNRDKEKVVKLTSDYCLKKIYGSDPNKETSLDYELLQPFDDIENPPVNTNAQYCLGIAYENGYGVTENAATAYKYFKLSADQGNIFAKNYIPYYYNKDGIRMDENPENKGIKCHTFANEFVIEKNLFYSSNKKEEIKIAKRDLIAARSNYCLKILKSKNPSLPSTSYQWLKPIEKELFKPFANHIGQYCLGYYYQSIYGRARNFNEAFKYYKLSADQGCASAQNSLGNCYYDGKGVTKDLNLAFKYYKLSADQGDAVAQNNLGYCYYVGEGVMQDFNESFKYYKLSADQGDALALNNLGAFYQYGKEVVKDLNEAFKYYKRAADQGSLTALLNLGISYQYGKGVIKDLNEAFKYYKLAADQGIAMAKFNLMVYYQHGECTARDLNKAFKYYKLAMNQDDPLIQFNLGICHQKGFGTIQDINKAFKYYKLAADQGFHEAQEKIKELHNIF